VTTYTDLIRYRELFGSLWRRDLESRYKGSLLGVLWVLIPPLVLMGVYLFVFHYMWRTTQVRDYPLYLLAGLAPWVFFSASVQSGTRAMVSAAPLIRKVRFPRQLTAFAVVGTNLVTFAVMLAIVLVLCLVFIPESRDVAWLALPLSVLLVGLTAGIALAVATLNVLFRDVEHVVASALLPWFFLTPVIWDESFFPGHETLKEVLRWVNPLTPPIEAIRDPLWAGTAPRLADVVYLAVAAVVSLALGAWVFSRVDDRIAVEL
jgi:homopolymeric O-antigen transport system permease protein